MRWRMAEVPSLTTRGRPSSRGALQELPAWRGLEKERERKGGARKEEGHEGVGHDITECGTGDGHDRNQGEGLDQVGPLIAEGHRHCDAG